MEENINVIKKDIIDKVQSLDDYKKLKLIYEIIFGLTIK